MADLWHEMGGDLSLSATGDLLMADGPDMTRQRVLRRLLTNAGELIFHLRYGAGLPRFVGQPIRVGRIQAIVGRQMKMERGVGPNPPPTVDVISPAPDQVVATIRYADAATGQQQTVVARP